MSEINKNNCVNISIRKATLFDLELIQKLNHEIMYQNAQFDPYLDIDFDLKDVGKEFFKEAIESKDGIFLLAFDGEKPVGYVNGNAKEAVYKTKKYFELENLGVIPSHCRKGIAKRLYNEFQTFAKDKGFEVIYLNCFSKNLNAIGFYKALGFDEVDVSFEKLI